MTALLPWQQSQWNHIVKRIQQDTMPHALLLNGAEGIGKQRFAEHLAAAMTCQSSIADAPCGNCKSCSLQQAGTHPDIILITPEEKGKAIRIDAIRDLIEMSGKTTQNGKQRVVIISPAEGSGVVPSQPPSLPSLPPCLRTRISVPGSRAFLGWHSFLTGRGDARCPGGRMAHRCCLRQA